MAKREDVDIQKDLAEYLQQTVSGLASEKKLRKELIDQLKDTEDLSEKILKIEETQNLIATKFVGIQSKVGDKFEKELEIAKEKVKFHKKYNEEWDKTYDKVSSTADNITSSLTDPIKNGLSMIPIFGDDLANMVPTDKLRESIQSGLTNTLMSAKGVFGKVGAEGVVAMEGVGAAGTTAGASTLAAFGPITVILAAIAAAAYLVKKAFDYDKETTELARGLSISKHEAHELKAEVEGISMREPLATTEELMGSMTELAGAYSNTKGITEEMITDHAKLVKFMGMSNEEATQFTTIAGRNNKSARELQGEVAAVVQGFNDATGATVSLGKVLKEIANTSASVRNNFKGGVPELARAVAQAQSLGTTVEDLFFSTKSMLNIEDSLSKQYTAQVLLGRQLNLDAIRSAQLFGDQGKAQDLLLESIAEQGDLSKENQYVVEQLADAYGMSAEQLLNMNDRALMNKKLGMDTASATAEEVRQRAKLLGIDAESLIRQKESQEVGARFAKLWDLISAAIDKMVSGPLAGVIDGMTAFLEDGETISMIFDGIGVAFKLLTRGIAIIWSRVKAVMDVFKGIKQMINGDIVGGLKTIGGGIFDFIVAPFKIVGEAVGDLFDWIMSLFGVTTDLGGIISEYLTFDKLIEGVQWLWQGIKDLGTMIWENIVAPFKMVSDIWDSITGNEANVSATPTSDNSPKMASGGIVSTATKAIIGEAGPEAVVPLDKFYAKLDAIAQAINSNGGGETTGNQPVILHVHFDDGTVQKIGNRNTYLQRNGSGLGIRKV